MVFLLNFFRCSSNETEQFNLFPPTNAKRSWPKCERRVLVLYHCVLASFWRAVFHRFLLPLELACHWPEEFANCTPTAAKNLNTF
jgi:hypothetical protein